MSEKKIPVYFVALVRDPQENCRVSKFFRKEQYATADMERRNTVAEKYGLGARYAVDNKLLNDLTTEEKKDIFKIGN